MDEWMTMISDCEKRESKLTEWEISFIDSLSKQLGDDKALTEKQSSRLNTIWERVTG